MTYPNRLHRPSFDDAAAVVPLSQDLVRTVLDTINPRYRRDQKGNFCFSFESAPQTDVPLDVRVAVSGRQNDILSISVHADKAIPRPSWRRALNVCNAWNRDNRFLTAFLRELEDGFAEIRLESHLFLAAGVHARLLEQCITVPIAGAAVFWGHAQQQGL